MAYRLGIDHGTTNTVASVAADGAPVQLGYLTSMDSDAGETMPGEAASSPSPPQWAQAPATVPTAGLPAVRSSPQTAHYRAEMASSAYPQGPRPPGSPQQGPGSAPSPGPYGPNVPEPGAPGSPGARPSYPPGPPLTQPYGAGGGPGGPSDYPPGPAGEGSGGSGSKLISIIASAVVLVGVAVGVGFLISGRGEPGSATASPSGFFPPVSPPGPAPPLTASPSKTPSGARAQVQARQPVVRPPRALRRGCRRRRRFRRAWSSCRCGSMADPTARCIWSTPRGRSSRLGCRALMGAIRIRSCRLAVTRSSTRTVVCCG